MPADRKNIELFDHEIFEHVARLESTMTVTERSAQLRSIRVERGLDDSLRVLLAYADRYPRGGEALRGGAGPGDLGEQEIAVRTFCAVLLVVYTLVVVIVAYEAATADYAPGAEYPAVFCPNWVLGFLAGSSYAGLCWLCRDARDLQRGRSSRSVGKYLN